MAKQVERDASQHSTADDAAKMHQPDSHECWGEARGEPVEPIDPISAIVSLAIVRQAAKQVEQASKQKLAAKAQASLTAMFSAPKPKNPLQASTPEAKADTPGIEENSPSENKQQGDKSGGQQPRRRSKSSNTYASPAEASPLVKIPVAVEVASAADKKQEGGKSCVQQPRRRSKVSKVDAVPHNEPVACEGEIEHSERVQEDRGADSTITSVSDASPAKQIAHVKEGELAAPKAQEDCKNSSQQAKKKPRLSKAEAPPVGEQAHDVQAKAAETSQDDCKDGKQQKRKSRCSTAPPCDKLGTLPASVTEAEASAVCKEGEEIETGDKQPKKKSRASNADTTPTKEPVEVEAEAAAVGKAQDECKSGRGRLKKNVHDDSKVVANATIAATASAAAPLVGELAQLDEAALASKRQRYNCKDNGQQRRKSRSSKPPSVDEVGTLPTTVVDAEASAADKVYEETKAGDKQPKKQSRSSKADTTPAEEPAKAEAEATATGNAQDECKPTRGRPKKKVQDDSIAEALVTASAAVAALDVVDAVVIEEAQGFLRKAEALEAAALTLRSAGCLDQAAALEGEAAGLRQSARDHTDSLAGIAGPSTIRRRLASKVALEGEAPSAEPPPLVPSEAKAKPARKTIRSSFATKSKQVKCPQDHALTSFTVLPAEVWGCSLCGKEFGPGSLLFGCRACDYDICEECSNQATVEPASPPLPSPTADLSAAEAKQTAVSAGASGKK